ncbi:uncharacterized protein LOC132663666 [Panthera onca]
MTLPPVSRLVLGVQVGDGQRKEDRGSEAGSALTAVSPEWDLNSQIVGSCWMFNHWSHPGRKKRIQGDVHWLAHHWHASALKSNWWGDWKALSRISEGACLCWQGMLAVGWDCSSMGSFVSPRFCRKVWDWNINVATFGKDNLLQEILTFSMSSVPAVAAEKM